MEENNNQQVPEELRTEVEKVRTQFADKHGIVNLDDLWDHFGNHCHDLIGYFANENERLRESYANAVELAEQEFGKLYRRCLPYATGKKRTISQKYPIPFYRAGDEYFTIIIRDGRRVPTKFRKHSSLLLTNFFETTSKGVIPKNNVETLTQRDLIKFVTECPGPLITNRQNIFRLALEAASPRKRSLRTLNEKTLVTIKRKLRGGASIAKIAREVGSSRKAIYQAIERIVQQDAKDLTKAYESYVKAQRVYRQSIIDKNTRDITLEITYRSEFLENNLIKHLTSRKAYFYAIEDLNIKEMSYLETVEDSRYWDLPGFRAAYYSKLKQWTRELRFALRGFDFEDLPTFD